MNAKDIEIAEKLLGWKLYNYDEEFPASSEEDYDEAMQDEGWTWEGKDWDTLDLDDACEWSPSGNIVHAIFTAKKVATLRFKLEQRGTEGTNWECRISTIDGKHGVVTAETEIKAICGALLEVVAYKESRRK